MKSKLLIFALCISTVWSNSVFSYIGEGVSSGLQQAKPKPGNVQKSAQCAPATQKYFMKFNDVNALIENGGSMFQNRQARAAGYEVPKGSNRFAIYSGSLWMGGTDVNNQLKLAALTFREGNDFWPGPLGSLTAGSGDYLPTSPVGTTVIREYGGATITPEQCLAYDKFDTITKALVIKFNNWWECNNQGAGVPVRDPIECAEINNNPLSSIEWLQIKNWPAVGDASLGEDHYIAPFYDRDGDTYYEPVEHGDYPWYDDIVSGRDDIVCGADRRVSLYGDATLWWIFNDKGNIHTETQGDPIGMEIRAQAFTFSTSDEVNRMTFFNYELINRGTTTLYNTYFSQFLDPDVGLYSDDYVGCDVSRGLGYAYNGDDYDEDGSGKFGYGENPPAIGVDFFEGPYLDADGIDNKIYNAPDANHANGDTASNYPYIVYSSNAVSDAIANNGIVYKGIGIGYSDNVIDNERFGMRRFSYFTSDAVYPFKDPATASQYYNFMKGNWANSVAMTYGGAGQAPSGTVTSYIFPDDSDDLGWATQGAIVNDQWSEKTAGNPAGDRRFVQSAGPFTLKPGAFNNITVGIVYGRGTEGSAYASVAALKKADTKAQALFDNCFKILDPPMAPKLTIQELENGLVLMLDNPSSSNNYKEKYSEVDKINITMDTLNDGTVVTDEMKTYVFEGYMIYQLKNESSSAADIGNEDKARLVAQCDIQNGVSKLINFEYDEGLGFDNPKLKVNGSNTGIKHSFKLTKDAFASGTNTLVNNKTYYYVAIAYAYNQYKKYDPNDALLLDGQKIPFISSRLGFNGVQIKPVSAVPHNPTLEADGTNVFADYGDSPLITRLDGTGNGNRNLELTQDSKDKIVQLGFLDKPVYENQGGPINVKVIDPLNVADGYFELKFRDYVAPQVGALNLNGADTASWTIYRYDSEGGSLIDSVNSLIKITSSNEQLIPQWGVSVEIKQQKYTGTTTNLLYTSPITSSVTFADSSTRWMYGVPDDGAFYPTNWIRTGAYDAPVADSSVALLYRNPWCYKDEGTVDVDRKYSKMAGGAVAPHRLTGYQCDYMPLAYYDMPITATIPNPGNSRTNSTIAALPSVDIVLTNDKSKWTRCPVFELGRDVNLTVGGAKAGALRKSSSVNKEGVADGSGTGMGWFPGYAIDIETGARLYMAFGENSFLAQDNGADMIWNPTANFADNNGNPIFGGQHAVYIYSYKQLEINKTSSVYYDLGAYDESNNEVYNLMTQIEAGNNAGLKRSLYSSLTWVANPVLTPGQKLLACDVTIKLRVNKEYKNFSATGKNGGKPMYSWNTNTMSTKRGVSDALADGLKLINVVPNPYYAYSEYERNRVDTRVKITNLPEKCTVRIYSVNGKLMRTFKKDSEITSIDWDLNNQIGVAVSSGVYLIHVEVPGVGERVIKFFGGMRQVDLHGI
jgi:hypothetical protein